MSDVAVRRTGASSHPWEAHCTQHSLAQETYFTDFGAVAFNTRGVGNRLWGLAMLAAYRHIRRFHTPPPPGRPAERTPTSEETA